jgi:transcription elongation factor Elf1
MDNYLLVAGDILILRRSGDTTMQYKKIKPIITFTCPTCGVKLRFLTVDDNYRLYCDTCHEQFEYDDTIRIL